MLTLSEFMRFEELADSVDAGLRQTGLEDFVRRRGLETRGRRLAVGLHPLLVTLPAEEPGEPLIQVPAVAYEVGTVKIDTKRTPFIASVVGLRLPDQYPVPYKFGIELTPEQFDIVQVCVDVLQAAKDSGELPTMTPSLTQVLVTPPN